MSLPTNSLTMFTWGYWGWGNATEQLVRAVRAVEEARGFGPPLFIDIRFSRSVLARGFKGNAFEKLLGADYRWMPDLGNRRIGTRKGGVKIDRPAAAEDLLDVALDAAGQGRRVLFFCACDFPRCEGELHCHRVTVAGLLLKAARQRGGPDLKIVEWPGGEPDPQPLEMPSTPATIAAVRRGRQTAPLNADVDLAQGAGLPWGTIVRLNAESESLLIATGPAQFKQQWVLPVLYAAQRGDDLAAVQKEAERVRRQRGLETSANYTIYSGGSADSTVKGHPHAPPEGVFIAGRRFRYGDYVPPGYMLRATEQQRGQLIRESYSHHYDGEIDCEHCGRSQSLAYFGQKSETCKHCGREFEIEAPDPVETAPNPCKGMRALSVQQPWAELMLRALKCAEYRSDPTNVRGRIYIYASRSGPRRPDDETEEFAEREYGVTFSPDHLPGLTFLDFTRLPRGVLIGTVELYQCVETDDGFAWCVRKPQRATKLRKPRRQPRPRFFCPF